MSHAGRLRLRGPLTCALAGGALVAACSDTSGPSTSNLPACTGIVTVSVSAGATPRFSWKPACKAFLLLIEPEGSGADQWGIITDSTNAIAPPVTYGVVPAGAQQDAPPVALLEGQPYKVYLFRWTGPGAQDGDLIGMQGFTP